jgi:hypothetical protein
MSTRADLRADLRLSLEDSAGTSHSWSDAELNEALRLAMREYGTQHPIELSTTLAVNTAASSYTLPVAIPDGRDLVTVLDGTGAEIPRDDAPITAGYPTGPLLLSWRTFGNQLLLSTKPGAAATWSLLYRTPRQLVEDEVTPQTIPADDEPLLVRLAQAAAIEQRAIADLKRGATRSAAELRRIAAELRESAATLARQRTRKARGGTL